MSRVYPPYLREIYALLDGSIGEVSSTEWVNASLIITYSYTSHWMRFNHTKGVKFAPSNWVII